MVARTLSIQVFFKALLLFIGFVSCVMADSN